jgi:hypothetical protein
MHYNRRSSKFLKGLVSYRVAPDLQNQVIADYLQSLDCPRALAVYLLFVNNEHEQLANLGFDPLHYSTVEALRDAYAATKFLSKFKGLTLSYDLDDVALKKFLTFEEMCRLTNSRFRNLALDPSFVGPNVWLLNAVTRKIAFILGEFSFEEWLAFPDWGPGASTLIKRKDASSQEKFQCETGVTRDLFTLFPPDLIEKIYPRWGQHLKLIGYPTFQIGNEIITVPKDASTNRVIAKEPGINLWFQLSIGKMIKRRLLRAGIDLTDQTINSHFALIGSQTGDYATVDYSSASDSIASKMIEEVLPPQWFSVMDLCRTRYGTLKGQQRRWEKFSSMGNGFTFPLQSLVFFALAKSCVEYLHIDDLTVSVYGDDVIIPTSAFKLFSEASAFFGFRINEKKSHFCSTFRESCGAHFASGRDVKPFFLKEELSSILTVYRTANAIRRLGIRRGSKPFVDHTLSPVFDHLVQSVPGAFRIRIPDGFGDGGFISNLDEASPVRCRNQIEGFDFVHVTEVGKSYLDERQGYLLAELWRLARRDEEFSPSRDYPSRLQAIGNITSLDSGVKGRNSVSSHQTQMRVVKSLARQWPDLGC